MWDFVQAEVQVRCGREAEVGSLLLAMSPCCRTFSRADSSNKTRGHNYRLSGEDHPTRPPKDLTSAKGREAQAADRMVRKAISVARYFVNKLGAWFYIENLAGSMQTTLYAWLGAGQVSKSFGALLRIPSLLSQADPHLDEPGRGEVAAQGHDGNRALLRQMYGGGAVSDGEVDANKQMMPRMLHLEILKAAGMA